jgi:hypothetical protein
MTKQALRSMLAALEAQIDAFPPGERSGTALDRRHCVTCSCPVVSDRGDEFRGLKSERDALRADLGAYATVHSDGEVGGK